MSIISSPRKFTAKVVYNKIELQCLHTSTGSALQQLSGIPIITHRIIFATLPIYLLNQSRCRDGATPRQCAVVPLVLPRGKNKSVNTPVFATTTYPSMKSLPVFLPGKRDIQPQQLPQNTICTKMCRRKYPPPQKSRILNVISYAPSLHS